MQRRPIKPVIQVFAHASLFHRIRQIALARGQKARHVIARGLGHAHDPALNFVRNIANLVDQQGTTLHPRQHPRGALQINQI